MSDFLGELSAAWRRALVPQLDMDCLRRLEGFVDDAYARTTVYPPRGDLFRAFSSTDYDDVKALLLGQDPYHESGQACGVAFAVYPGTKRPGSLRNILKEYVSDLGYPEPAVGDVSEWSRRGVLMLNSVLTVREGAAGSHQHHGWEMFTDGVIRALSARRKPLAFILWGKPAEKKEPLIDVSVHGVIKSAHPSPLSAYRGFLGSRPFSRVNEFLTGSGCAPIDWRLA